MISTPLEKKKKKHVWICIRPALWVCCKGCTLTLPYKCMHAPITSKWWARGRIGFRSRGCFKVRCFFYVWIVNELDSFHAGCMHVWWMWKWHRAMHFPQCERRAGVRGLTKGFFFFFFFFLANVTSWLTQRSARVTCLPSPLCPHLHTSHVSGSRNHNNPSAAPF